MDSALKRLARRAIPRGLRNRLRSPALSFQWWLEERRPPVRYAVRPDWSITAPRNAVWSAFRLQVDDPEQAAEFDDFVRVIRGQPRSLLLDIGCHFGLFSFAAVHYGGAGSAALAIDPSSEAERMVRRVSALNGCDKKIQFVRAAAGAENGELQMVETGVTGAGYMVLPSDHPDSERVRIPLRTIDSLAESWGRTPTVVKIDVESYEFEAALGGAKTLAGASIPLCLELHNEMARGRGADPAALLDLLRDLGYRNFCQGSRALERQEMLDHPLIRVVARRA